MKSWLVIFIFSSLVSLQCSNKETEENERQVVVDINGFFVTDALGNDLTLIGSAGFDWQILDWSQLSATEKGFLNFSESINLNNTVVTTLNQPKAYPSPFYNTSPTYINFHSTDSVKVKLAVVNKYGDVLKTFAIKIKGNTPIALDFSDNTKFPSGTALRYYFSYSAAAQQNFKAGYGDVKVCNQMPQSQCF
jgi:hypothetical protein